MQQNEKANQIDSFFLCTGIIHSLYPSDAIPANRQQQQRMKRITFSAVAPLKDHSFFGNTSDNLHTQKNAASKSALYPKEQTDNQNIFRQVLCCEFPPNRNFEMCNTADYCNVCKDGTTTEESHVVSFGLVLMMVVCACCWRERLTQRLIG